MIEGSVLKLPFGFFQVVTRRALLLRLLEKMSASARTIADVTYLSMHNVYSLTICSPSSSDSDAQRVLRATFPEVPAVAGFLGLCALLPFHSGRCRSFLSGFVKAEPFE